MKFPLYVVVLVTLLGLIPFNLSPGFVEATKFSLEPEIANSNAVRERNVLSSSVFDQGGLRMEWSSNGDFDIDIPDNWDCDGDCKGSNHANKCDIGICFEICFDKDKDFYISEKEVDKALNDKLSWVERMATDDAKHWVRKFDGLDGSEKDGKISALELHSADSSKCKDLKTIYDYLCMRCKTYKKAIGA